MTHLRAVAREYIDMQRLDKAMQTGVDVSEQTLVDIWDAMAAADTAEGHIKTILKGVHGFIDSTQTSVPE